jgi:membrane protease YdiL (CAAX protease family)
MRLDKLKYFIFREKLYIGLIIFIIAANLSLSSLNNFLENTSILKIFDKEAPSEEEKAFDQKIMDAISSEPKAYNIFLISVLIFLVVILLGIALDAVYLYRTANNMDTIMMTQSVDKAGWGLWDISKVIIIFFFAQSTASLVVLITAFFFPGSLLSRNMELALVAAILDVIVVAAVLYFVMVDKRQGLGSLGLTVKNAFLNMKYGVSAYIGLVPVFFIVTVATAIIFKVLNIPVEPQEVVEIFREEKSLPSLISLGIFTSFFGPLMEEIFFRGFVYGALKSKIGISGAILGSATFFAYVHANLASFMPILSFGILLAYLYEKTGSLVSSITAHILHNSLMLAFLLLLKTIAG